MNAPGTDEITTAEGRLLEAWRLLRGQNAWQDPTVAELAEAVGRTPQTVHGHIRALCSKGVVVRMHDNRRSGRCYALASEAAARPHLRALMRLAVDIVRLRPSDMDGDDGPERYRAMWAQSHAVCRAIVASAAHAPAGPSGR